VPAAGLLEHVFSRVTAAGHRDRDAGADVPGAGVRRAGADEGRAAVGVSDRVLRVSDVRAGDGVRLLRRVAASAAIPAAREQLRRRAGDRDPDVYRYGDTAVADHGPRVRDAVRAHGAGKDRHRHITAALRLVAV